MILNLAPIRSYHLDSLSSLTFANRTKKIVVREIENEPIAKGNVKVPTFTGPNVHRQPLRPLHNGSMNATTTVSQKDEQPKTFAVYSDRSQPSMAPARMAAAPFPPRSSPLKRSSDPFTSSVTRPAKRRTPFITPTEPQPRMSKQALEDIIERKVTDILAARALDQNSIPPQPEISEEVQRRLDMLEKKIEGREDGREQGLTFLLMAKQHAVRGEDASALRMYKLAKDFFPDNEKLGLKIETLRKKLNQRQESDATAAARQVELDGEDGGGIQNRRAQDLLDIINSGDITRLRKLKGVGAKKAEAIQDALGQETNGERTILKNLEELSSLKGVGFKAVENMIAGL